MRSLFKILLNLCAFVSFLVLIYTFHESGINNLTIFGIQKDDVENTRSSIDNFSTTINTISKQTQEYNIWLILTKATPSSTIRGKFSICVRSLLKLSSVRLSFHVITDSQSKIVATDVFEKLRNISKVPFEITYWDVKHMAQETKMSELIDTMQPHFSSQPGSYYSDVLFFLSLGLHHVAIDQEKAVMIDVDTKVLVDIKYLFNEMDRFKDTELLGIAPEQTPVYRHVLYMYRAKNRNTTFGKPLSDNGNPGVNSGVLLLWLSRMRESKLYNSLQSRQEVDRLAAQYMFHGHLGDQDWYTLISEQHPKLIHLLECGWNRQLCQWWNHHGYRDIFELFYKCDTPIRIYHGNCNTPIPDS